jgi:hypothetical protein
MVLTVPVFFFQGSLQHNSSDSDHSVRPYPQGFYGGITPGPPSFTAMPILGMPRNQLHGSKPQQHSFNSYDHQRVGSFRSRLKKQHPISCSETSDTASTNLFVPVDVERVNQRDVSTPFPIGIPHSPVIRRNTSPTNEQTTSQRKECSSEMSYNTYHGPPGKNLVASLASSNTSHGNQVQSFVMVEANNTAGNDRLDTSQQSTISTSNLTMEANFLLGNSKKTKQHKKFWHIGGLGGSGSSSRSGGSNKSNSFHSSKGSKDSKDMDGMCSKDNTNATKYLSVSYKSQD